MGRSRQGTKRYVAYVAAAFLLLAVSLLASAGSLSWPAGWAFLAVHGLNQAVVTWLLVRLQPELAASRLEERGDEPRWDALLALVMAHLGPLVLLIVAGLDRRNGWSGRLPDWSPFVGLGLVLLGGIVADWAMLVNPFFVGRVRVQDERGHQVISRGPYSVVRHPGYLGAVAFLLGSPIALGSLWALLPAALVTAASAARTELEDRTLQAELEGYAGYCRRVRYRLFPRIW